MKQQTASPASTVRAICYARVSTAGQAASGLGIAAQRAATTAYANAFGWEIAASLDENGVSGMMSPDTRPVLGAALADLDAGRASVLVVSHLSRVGRDTRDVLALADRAEAAGWGLVALDIGIDTTTAAGRLMLTMLAGIARWERDVIAARTSEALAQKKRQGARLGRPVEQSPTAMALAVRLRESGMSYAKIAARLTAEGLPTARGGKWHGSTVSRLVRSAALDAEALALRSAPTGPEASRQEAIAEGLAAPAPPDFLAIPRR